METVFTPLSALFLGLCTSFPFVSPLIIILHEYLSSFLIFRSKASILGVLVSQPVRVGEHFAGKNEGVKAQGGATFHFL